MQKKRDLKELEQRRIKGVELLKKGKSQAQVARDLGVSRTSVKRWQDSHRQGGKAALKRAERAGPKSKLTPSQKELVVEKLLKGAEANGYTTDLWTLKRVVALIEKHTGRKYTQAGVWFLLRELGFSNQRPVTKAIQRNEKEIENWKKYQWPRIKKTPIGKNR